MAIAYSNGGDHYLGTFREKTIEDWKKLGASLSQQFMYKGYHYFNGKKDVVVVFNLRKWSSTERKMRQANGFLGIREYRLPVSQTKKKRQ